MWGSARGELIPSVSGWATVRSCWAGAWVSLMGVRRTLDRCWGMALPSATSWPRGLVLWSVTCLLIRACSARTAAAGLGC